MNKFRQTALVIAAISLVPALPTQAGELTQSFVNPSFGGNPLNGSYLLPDASAQNNYTAPTKAAPASASTSASSSKNDTAQQFSEQVNRLVMSALASRLVNQAFGSSTGTGPDNTSIDTGISTISVATTASGTTVTIKDNATGGQSVISIPNF